MSKFRLATVLFFLFAFFGGCTYVMYHSTTFKVTFKNTSKVDDVILVTLYGRGIHVERLWATQERSHTFDYDINLSIYLGKAKDLDFNCIVRKAEGAWGYDSDERCCVVDDKNACVIREYLYGPPIGEELIISY